MSVIEAPVVAPPEKLAEPDPVLLEAARLIRERGWWQNDGEGCDSAETLCASLAIGEGGGSGLNHSHMAFARSIGWKGGDFGYLDHIFTWNDAPKRTEAEVVTALENAAWGL